MKKIIKYIFVLFFIFTATTVFGSDFNVYVFEKQGCVHCKAAEHFLVEYQNNHNFNLILRDIHDLGNEGIMDKLVKYFNTNIGGTPFIVIGDDYVLGNDQDQLKEKIDYCENNQCDDVIDKIYQGESQKQAKDLSEIKIPGLNIQIEDFSLLLITIIMGFVDGFNPCAMWALIFLITLLLGMKDKKRRYILGITFITVSGAVYYGFMVGWLSIIQKFNTYWLQIIIGLLALGLGINYLIKAVKNKKAVCKVSKIQKNQMIFEKLKEFVQKPSLLVALLGIAVLGFFVNLVELLCSAALPVVYTQILTASNLTPLAYYGYILLYIIFFMIDDIIIFAIAMYSLKVVGTSSKSQRWINLIAGVVMILISVFLIF